MIKSGSKVVACLSHHSYQFVSNEVILLFQVDKKDIVIRGIPGLNFNCSEDMLVYVSCANSKTYWTYNEFPNVEYPDPIPFEVSEEDRRPDTLEQKMQRFLGQMVAERYGHESEELDSVEESLDFEMDDEEPLSGYEVIDMVDEAPIIPLEETAEPVESEVIESEVEAVPDGADLQAP